VRGATGYSIKVKEKEKVNMIRYYKLIRGYGAEDYIEITEDELEKAQYAFLAKKDSVYSGGAVRGADILAIQPDYHRAMGWNRGYKLGPDDYAELSETGVSRNHMTYLAEIKDKVQHLIKTGKTELIGKNVDIKLLD
jgi:hypothetical protein